MRIRTIAGAVALSSSLVVGLPQAAGAAGESVGGCVLEKVHELEENAALTEEQRADRAETALEDCRKSPNPILPPVNEIIWGGLAFLILLGAMWKVALPPIKKGMQARSDKIRNDLLAAEQARVEAEQVQAQYNARLADARAEAQRIIDDARQTADSLKADLQRRAEVDIAELRQRAAADVEASKAQALADVRGEVAALALGAAELVVERNLDASTQAQLIENYINTVGASR
ncbi:MAG: F0F1 ATP synthase subunit B [Acidimicrobiales bacterium]